MRVSLALMIAVCFATATMGRPLTGEEGKFAASNIPPIVFAAVASLMYVVERKSIRRDFAWIFLAFNASALLSFAIFLFRFHWTPNFLVLLFQDVEVVFAALLLWYGAHNLALFRRAVRLGIYGSIPIIAFFALQDFSSGKPFSTFGMDDHSHAAVIFCAEAYLLCRFFGSPLDRAVGLGFLVISFLTISRLPIFFVPAILLAFSARSKWAVALGIAVTCGCAYILVTAGGLVSEVFRVYDRLSSIQTISGEASTSAHLLLLKAALEIKFSDLWAFLCGTGPGNFSKAFTSFAPDAAMQIGSLDPKLFADAQEGRAPLHSVTVQTLLDYSLPFFLLLLFLIGKGFSFLLRTRRYLDFLFFGGLFAASTFYSLHNKPYFYLLVATAALLSLTTEPQPSDSRSLARAPPASPRPAA